MKFRQHRGGYRESMDTCVDVRSLDDLAVHIRKIRPDLQFERHQIDIRPYGRGVDDRNGWHTHSVEVAGTFVGFTDGPAVQVPDST